MSTVMHDPLTLLKEHFGFDQFRDGQQQVIEFLLGGRSSAAVFPTGGGKSLCYQLPAIAFAGVTLVVSPLIALMKDQIDALAKRGIAAARLDSSLSSEQYQEVMTSLRDGSLRLLYVAPERFNSERFREMLGTLNVSLFAVDEAHCISEWGHNFRPDYLKLARFAQDCGAERILALTATATPKVLDDICREFEIREENAVRTDFYRENLQLVATATNSDERDELLLSRLRERPRGATIVYVTLQKTAADVAKLLQDNQFEAKHYHAGLKPDARAETQEWFIAEESPIVVATIAFGMGIDKSNIRYVYHYNLSKSIENYAQEIGRAGRDGEPSLCETLLVPEDMRTLENFVYGDTPDVSAVHSLVADVFSRGPEFGISFYQLSAKHDIRELVVRTLLTYMELEGYLKGGTPYYAEYKFKPLMPSAKMLGHFDQNRKQFLSTIFKQAKQNRVWFTLDVEKCIAATKSDRQRVIRALDYLAEREMIELQTAGVHHPFRVLQSPDVAELAQSLYEKSLARQDRELERLQVLMQLMTLDGCQTSALGGYFGEPLPQPCGHCSWCEQEKPVRLSDVSEAEIDDAIWAKIESLKADHPDVFANPRAAARFACGITSPLLVKAKLSRHELFGCLADVPFEAVLAR